MKLKTSELTGPALRWAVAKALDDKEHFEPYYPDPYDGYGSGPFYTLAEYDIDRSLGGPIIERKKIKVAPSMGGTWLGQIRHSGPHELVAHPVLTGWTNQHGPTPRIAAMRCFVASELGDEVDVPKELLS